MWTWLATVVVLTAVLYFLILLIASRHDRRNQNAMFDWKD